MTTKPDDNVHPVNIPWANGLGNDTYPGLVKREYFAAMAMQGLLANGNAIEGAWCVVKDLDKSREEKIALARESLAAEFVTYADALIAALNQSKQTE